MTCLSALQYDIMQQHGQTCKDTTTHTHIPVLLTCFLTCCCCLCCRSQCKSECHAITSSKCSNLSIPACSVPGCGRCLAGYPHACTNCEANYTLNVDTKQCDCRPGFAGATTCTQCTGNTVSYGGKLPTAKCTACPTGRVADKAQTECVGELLGAAGLAARLTGRSA